MPDALHEAVALVDERRNQLGTVDAARAHGHELVPVIRKIGVHQFLGIVDLPYRRDGVQTKMRAHQQRLRVRVADAADAAAAAVKFDQILLKLRPEGRVGNRVDLPLTAVLPAPDRHAGVARAEMAVIVRAEKDVENDVALRHGTEKTAHQAKNSSDSVIGSTY